MSFNKNYLNYLLGILIIASLGCAKEDAPANKVLQTKSERTRCLSQLPNQLERYFDGQSNRKEVDTFWNCVDDAFKLFRVYVNGNGGSTYTPEELRKFFHIFFLKDSEITDGLLLEISHIKKLLFGGSIESITDKELDQVMSLLDQFHDWTVQFLPHVGVVSRHLDRRNVDAPTDEQIELAAHELEALLGKIGAVLGQSKVNYDFLRLRSLLHELGILFSGGNPNSRFASLDKLYPVLVRVKLMLIGPNPSAIEPNDWVRLMDVIGRFSSSWIKIREALDQQIWYFANGLKFFIDGGNGILKILQDSLSQRPDQLIPSSEIHLLLEELNDLIDFSRFVEVDTLKSVVDVLVKSFLGRPANEETADLTLAKVGILKKHWNSWVEIQKVSSDIQSENRISQVSRRQLLDRLSAIESNQSFLSVTDFKSIIDDKKRLPINLPLGRGYLVTDYAETNLSSESLGFLNLTRAGLRMIFDAYGEVDTLGSVGVKRLNKTQFTKAYNDFKPVAIDLGLLQPGDDSLFEGLLLQLDLFLGSSNGNRLIEMNELVEFILVALNALEISEQINSPQFCEPAQGKLISTRCLKELFVESDLNMFTAVPGLRSYLLSAGVSGRKKAFKTLQKIAFGSGEFVESGKVIEAAILLQFVEVLLLKFDENKDGAISVLEARSDAYPHFAEALKELVPFLPNEFQREGFLTYILNFGEPPDPALNPIHEIQFKHWLNNPLLWNFKADRGRLIEVLGALNSF